MANPGDPRGHRHYRTRRQAAARRWAQDNAPCWLCQGLLGPIDYTAPAGTWNALDADHVDPVSNGTTNPLDISQWRASHSRCNRQRGNKTPEQFRAWLQASMSNQGKGKSTKRSTSTTSSNNGIPGTAGNPWRMSTSPRQQTRPTPAPEPVTKPRTTRSWYTRTTDD